MAYCPKKKNTKVVNSSHKTSFCQTDLVRGVPRSTVTFFFQTLINGIHMCIHFGCAMNRSIIEEPSESLIKKIILALEMKVHFLKITLAPPEGTLPLSFTPHVDNSNIDKGQVPFSMSRMESKTTRPI